MQCQLHKRVLINPSSMDNLSMDRIRIWLTCSSTRFRPGGGGVCHLHSHASDPAAMYCCGPTALLLCCRRPAAEGVSPRLIKILSWVEFIIKFLYVLVVVHGLGEPAPFLGTAYSTQPNLSISEPANVSLAYEIKVKALETWSCFADRSMHQKPD